jgi:prepilin-type N-terminal cleavage/methylation domain-containing protein
MNQQRANRKLRADNRPGYTLVELLIVLAVLALILGLSLPAFRRLSSRNDVLDSARLLRAELVRARLRAIETGRPLLFQYQLGSGSFQIVPADDPNLSPRGSDEMSAAAAVVDAADRLPALHVGVVFVDPTQASGVASELFDESGGEWSEPIVFYANGRSHNGRFQVANGEYQVAVTLRGLTGAVRLAEIEPVERPENEPLQDVSVGF